MAFSISKRFGIAVSQPSYYVKEAMVDWYRRYQKPSVMVSAPAVPIHGAAVPASRPVSVDTVDTLRPKAKAEAVIG